MRKSVLFSLLFSIYCFSLSLILLFFYKNGDQIFYITFYETVSDYDFISGYVYYNTILGSQEPIYYIIVYFLNGIVSKNILFSIINACFAYCLAYLLLEKRKLSPIWLIPLAFNFYLIVLFTGAERLKVSLLFLLLAFTVSNRKVRSFFLITSIFAHVQTLVLVISTQVSKVLPLIKRLFAGKINYRFLGVIGAIFLLCCTLVLMQGHIVSKLNAYSSLGGIVNTVKPTLFLILTIFYTSNRKIEVFLMHFPLIVAAFFIGDMRIVIFSYFIFFYYASYVKRGWNLGVFISSFYFLIKGIDFIILIYKYGSGFPPLD